MKTGKGDGVQDHNRPHADVLLRKLHVIDESWKSPCMRDPDRWTTTADEGAKALCRGCPLRWQCAQTAVTTPGAEGVWAGILIPESGRARRFALRQLRSLAEQNGYPVRKTG